MSVPSSKRRTIVSIKLKLQQVKTPVHNFTCLTSIGQHLFTPNRRRNEVVDCPPCQHLTFCETDTFRQAHCHFQITHSCTLWYFGFQFSKYEAYVLMGRNSVLAGTYIERILKTEAEDCFETFVVSYKYAGSPRSSSISYYLLSSSIIYYLSTHTFKAKHYAALKSLRLYKVQHPQGSWNRLHKLKGRNCGGFKRHKVDTTFLPEAERQPRRHT